MLYDHGNHAISWYFLHIEQYKIQLSISYMRGIRKEFSTSMIQLVLFPFIVALMIFPSFDLLCTAVVAILRL
jgi:hypothetical protein